MKQIIYILHIIVLKKINWFMLNLFLLIFLQIIFLYFYSFIPNKDPI